jgi:hypothetical protein
MEATMLRPLRSRLSYANVTSTLALVLALGGGTAYATSQIRKSDIGYHAVTASKIAFNAVTGSKVRNSSLTGGDLRNSTITASDVRNGSLRSEDFGAGQLPKGEKGEKGDPAAAVFGVVSASGTVTNGKGITAVSPGDPGVYSVTFNQDVSKCAVVGTVATSGAGADDGGTVTAAPGATPQQFTLRTRDTAGAAAPRPFQFALFC